MNLGEFSWKTFQGRLQELFHISGPVIIFWTSLTASQYIMGLPLLNTVPGMPIVPSLFGAVIVGGSAIVSDKAFKNLHKSLFGTSHDSSGMSLKDTINFGYVTLFTFMILERGSLFRTVLPSSLLSVGAFAQGQYGGSIMATSAATTEAQRQTIQTLGHRFGCHHCGKHQLFSRLPFIADHMPPTAIVESNILKSFFRLQTKQKLWPQCQSCFRLQGPKVKSRVKSLMPMLFSQRQPLVFHHQLRLCHFTYLFVHSFGNDPFIREFFSPLVTKTIDFHKHLSNT